MKAIEVSEFRRHVSGLFADVEKGLTLVILRNGKPIAEIIPFSGTTSEVPAWKRPGIKLVYSGAELAAAILSERDSSS